MGLQDMLIDLELPYDSEGGRKVAGQVMQFVKDMSREMSVDLGVEKGVFPAYGDTLPYLPRRNAALTSIQPTGTVSMLANCSSGCEPHFSIMMEKNVMDGESFMMVNERFEKVARREGWYSDELMVKVEESGTVMGHDEIPVKWQNIFKTAMDIGVDDHLLMQSTLQLSGVDAAISKTINFPASATREEIFNAYVRGWEQKCKGLTVYRDGCRDNQPLTAGKMNDDTFCEKRPDNIVFTCAPKRPEHLDCDIHHCKVAGDPWVVIVGIYKGYPYEIFAGEYSEDMYIPQTVSKGICSKVGGGKYNLSIQIRNSEVVYKDIAELFMNDQYRSLTRLMSISLRHGTRPVFIVGQLKKGSISLGGFSSSVSRVLNKYMKHI
jgi:hypothetical protein